MARIQKIAGAAAGDPADLVTPAVAETQSGPDTYQTTEAALTILQDKRWSGNWGSIHVNPVDRLKLALAIEDRWISHQALYDACRDLKSQEKLQVAFRILDRFSNPDRSVRQEALHSLYSLKGLYNKKSWARILANLDEKWGEMPHLDSIIFADGGGGVTLLLDVARVFLPQISKRSSDFLRGVLGEYSGSEDYAPRLHDAPFVRSEVTTQADGSLLVQKNKFPNQDYGRLRGELDVAHYIQQKGIALQSPVIEPLGTITSHDQESILFRAPPNYYRYLIDEGVTEDEFFNGLSAAVSDAFTLAKHGLYHLVPTKLFHAASSSREDRHSDDMGRFTWMPDLVWDYQKIPGMGRLDDWLGSLVDANYGVTGLRDLEEVATLDEILSDIPSWEDRRIDQKKNWAPELMRLKEQHNARALYDMALLGNHLLAGMLFVGYRLRKEAMAFGPDEFWKQDDLLSPYAEKLRELFSLAYGVKHDVVLEEAKGLMTGKADWIRLSRQMAFFMTPAHAPFVEEYASVDKFPVEIYGPHTRIESHPERGLRGKMGPYRDNSVHPKAGFIGPTGNPTQPCLGPVNGQFPIREFERAAYAVFIPWHAGAQKRRPVSQAMGRRSAPLKVSGLLPLAMKSSLLMRPPVRL